MKAKRAPSDRYCEVAFAQLVNDAAEDGFVVTRLPGGLWIVTLAGGVDQVGNNLAQAVHKALEARNG